MLNGIQTHGHEAHKMLVAVSALIQDRREEAVDQIKYDNFTNDEFLTSAEWQITDKNAIEVFPDDMPGPDIWLSFKLVGKSYAKATEAAARLKPLLGRVLVLLRPHPEIYINQLGYTSWTQFMEEGVEYFTKVCRAEAFQCYLIGDQLGHLSPTEIESIKSYENLKTLAKTVKANAGRVSTTDQKRKITDLWMQDAQKMAPEKFKETIETFSSMEPGSLSTVTIQLTLSRPEGQELMGFLNNHLIQAFTETSEIEPKSARYGQILLRMKQECSTEWLAQAAQEGLVTAG